MNKVELYYQSLYLLYVNLDSFKHEKRDFCTAIRFDMVLNKIFENQNLNDIYYQFKVNYNSKGKQGKPMKTIEDELNSFLDLPKLAYFECNDFKSQCARITFKSLSNVDASCLLEHVYVHCFKCGSRISLKQCDLKSLYKEYQSTAFFITCDNCSYNQEVIIKPKEYL